MKKFAVVGYPVSHSKSPDIFNFFKEHFEFAGTENDFTYDRLEISPQGFAKSKDLLLQYDGLNVTSPLKEEVLELSLKKSPEVELLKAGNVLKKYKNKFEAHNTDVYGFKESLEGHKVEEMSALVLGSSGGARAAILGLHQMGVKDIFVKARDYSGYKNFDISVQEYSGQKTQIVVQATTIGMNGLKNPKDLDFFNIDFSDTQIAYDLIYSPKQTEFMKIAEKHNVPLVMNGESMLALQAMKSFEIWFGHQVVKSSAVLEKLKEIL